ncbi:MAG: c-type cytochrome [Acidimicrobiales bacterium]
MRATRLRAGGAGLVLLATAVAAAGSAGGAGQPEPPPLPPSEVRAGEELFQVACSSCHGLDGRGDEQGPSLIGVGEASVDFYLSTGRMPLDRPDVQAQRKEPPYTPRQIRQLVAYVTSLGPSGPQSGGASGGSGLATPEVDLEKGDLSLGNLLYANNCASCHSSAGAGGALGHSVYAPRLDKATPTQVAQAVRIGPGAMPRFGPDTLDDHQLASVVRYVDYLRHPSDPGGLGLGHLGPLPEGFVAWVVGLGLMVLAIRWIGTKD